MVRVWQTVTGGRGNCMQAAVASLLGLGLGEVPDFSTAGRGAMRAMVGFMWSRGYSFVRLLRPGSLDAARTEPGVDGYFLAVVRSVAVPGGHHAVVVDGRCRVVHPVNRAYEGMTGFPSLSPDEVNGVLYLFVFNPRAVDDTLESLRARRMSRRGTVRAAQFGR